MCCQPAEILWGQKPNLPFPLQSALKHHKMSSHPSPAEQKQLALLRRIAGNVDALDAVLVDVAEQMVRAAAASGRGPSN